MRFDGDQALSHYQECSIVNPCARCERAELGRKDEELLGLAIAARELGFVPYEPVIVDGREMEAISYPFPEKGALHIMVREKDDPSTLEECVLPPWTADFLVKP